ncbi:MAG: glycosyltransferase family 2 protein, partial [Chlorobiales bacterium]|nr:glycosyltransferase family 2 protein [Chlorobiales bacterium]
MKRNSKPLVTVTIPMYNNERFIRQTIESILAQTYTNFELLIYDDDSADESYEAASS